MPQLPASHRNPNRQRGVAALELALVFPVLFLMMYGLLSYGLIFAAQHSLAQSAAEGARAALRFDSLNDAEASRTTAACTMAKQGVRWLEQVSGRAIACQTQLVTAVQCQIPAALASRVRCLTVSLNYDYAATPILPRLPLLPTPQRLTGMAVTQIALSY